MLEQNTTSERKPATPKPLVPFDMTPEQFRNLIDADRSTADLTYEGEELKRQHFARLEIYNDYSGGCLIALYAASPEADGVFVASLEVSKDEILAHFTGRNEAEIVVKIWGIRSDRIQIEALPDAVAEAA